MTRFATVAAVLVLCNLAHAGSRLNNPPKSITVNCGGIPSDQGTAGLHNGTFTLYPTSPLGKEGAWEFIYYSNTANPANSSVAWMVTVNENNGITVVAGPGQFKAGAGYAVADVYTIGVIQLNCIPANTSTNVQITANP